MSTPRRLGRGRSVRQRLGAALSVGGVTLVVSGLLLSPTRAHADQNQATLALASDRFAQDFLKPLLQADTQLSNAAGGSPAARAAFSTGTADLVISGTPFTAQELTAAHPPTGYAYAPVAAGAIAFPYFVVEEQGSRTGMQDTAVKLSAPVISDLFTNQGTWNSPETTSDNGDALVANETHPYVLTGPDATSYWVTSWFTAEAHASWASYTATRNLVNQPYEQFPLGAPSLQQRDGFGLLLQGVFPNSAIKTEALAYAPLGALADLPPGVPPSPFQTPVLSIRNKSGSFVAPTPGAVSKALAAASRSTDGPTKNLVTPNFDAADTGAYPLIMVDEAIVPVTGVSASKARAIAAVLRQLVDPNYQTSAQARGYVPLTQPMVEATLAVATQLEQTQDPITTITTTTSQPGSACATSPTSVTTTSTTTSTSSSTTTSTSSTSTTAPSTTTSSTTAPSTTSTTCAPGATTTLAQGSASAAQVGAGGSSGSSATGTPAVAGTGLAGTGLAGTGLAGTGLAGTGLAGTGLAGTGLARTVAPSPRLSGASARSDPASSLPRTGGRPLVAPVAAGMAMVVVGELARRRAGRRSAPPRP